MAFDYNNFVSHRIYDLRMMKNMSSRELSISLNFSPSYVNNIENGKNSISLQNLSIICEFFNISLSEFFYSPKIDKTVDLQKQHLFHLIEQLNEIQIASIINIIESFIYPNKSK